MGFRKKSDSSGDGDKSSHRAGQRAGKRGIPSAYGFAMTCSSCSSDNCNETGPSGGYYQWKCNACGNEWFEPT